MTFAEATTLILHEGLEMDGIAVLVHAGDDPGRDRVRTLIAALRVAYEGLRGRSQVDRRLAYALFALSFGVQGTLAGEHRSREWSEELLTQEQYQLGMAVEGIFADAWQVDGYA